MRLIFWPNRILFLVCGCSALYLARSSGLSWPLTAAVVILPLLGVDLLLLAAVRGARRRFEQRLMPLLESGSEAELLALYRGELLLRFAAPRHYLLEKLGRIYARLGRSEAAAAAYQEALSDAPDKLLIYPITLGLANSLYALGEDAAAEEAYRSCLDDKHVNVQACANLARLIERRGGDPEESEEVMGQAVDAARGGLLRCELVQLHVAHGKQEAASAQLALAEEELAQGSEEERRTLQLARDAVSLDA